MNQNNKTIEILTKLQPKLKNSKLKAISSLENDFKSISDFFHLVDIKPVTVLVLCALLIIHIKKSKAVSPKKLARWLGISHFQDYCTLLLCLEELVIYRLVTREDDLFGNGSLSFSITNTARRVILTGSRYVPNQIKDDVSFLETIVRLQMLLEKDDIGEIEFMDLVERIFRSNSKIPIAETLIRLKIPIVERVILILICYSSSTGSNKLEIAELTGLFDTASKKIAFLKSIRKGSLNIIQQRFVSVSSDMTTLRMTEKGIGLWEPELRDVLFPERKSAIGFNTAIS